MARPLKRAALLFSCGLVVYLSYLYWFQNNQQGAATAPSKQWLVSTSESDSRASLESLDQTLQVLVSCQDAKLSLLLQGELAEQSELQWGSKLVLSTKAEQGGMALLSAHPEYWISQQQLILSLALRNQLRLSSSDGESWDFRYSGGADAIGQVVRACQQIYWPQYQRDFEELVERAQLASVAEREYYSRSLGQLNQQARDLANLSGMNFVPLSLATYQ